MNSSFQNRQHRTGSLLGNILENSVSVNNASTTNPSEAVVFACNDQDSGVMKISSGIHFSFCTDNLPVSNISDIKLDKDQLESKQKIIVDPHLSSHEICAQNKSINSQFADIVATEADSKTSIISTECKQKIIDTSGEHTTVSVASSLPYRPSCIDWRADGGAKYIGELDSVLRQSQSLRLPHVTSASSTALRSELEAQLLDTKVQEFQARSCPEREAMKNKLKRLSQIYSVSAEGSDEERRTWPISRRHCPPPLRLDMKQNNFSSVELAEKDESAMLQQFSQEISESCCIAGISSLAEISSGLAMSSKCQSTVAVPGNEIKSDTDSLSKDEGFETSSLSSDQNMTSSQRSSMCDCDATLTPTTDPKVVETATTAMMIITMNGDMHSETEVAGEDVKPSADADRCEGISDVNNSGCSSDSLELAEHQLRDDQLIDNPVDSDHEHKGQSCKLASTTKVATSPSEEDGISQDDDRLPKPLEHTSGMAVSGISSSQAMPKRSNLTLPRRHSLQTRLLLPSAPRHHPPSSLLTVKATSPDLPCIGTDIVKPPLAAARSITAVHDGTTPSLRAPTKVKSSARNPRSSVRGTTAAPTAITGVPLFVRGSATRATIAAPELHSNKKVAAAKARAVRGALPTSTTATVPHCGPAAVQNHSSSSNGQQLSTALSTTSSQRVLRTHAVSHTNISVSAVAPVISPKRALKVASKSRSTARNVTLPSGLHPPPLLASSTVQQRQRTSEDLPTNDKAQTSKKVSENSNHDGHSASTPSRLRAPSVRQ
jgi:hypothetical protein